MAWSKSDWVRLGDHIVAARISRKPAWERKDLATAAGVSTKTLGAIENGDLGTRKGFAQETILAVTGALEWPPTRWRLVLDDALPDGEQVWVSREAALDDEQMDEIEGQVEAYRTYLIEKARGLTPGQENRARQDAVGEESQDSGNEHPA